ncbi:hypothetical protein PInf_012601 [Phytophthora infestans]|nr:hypothetical protein PInf_012601 [Phytophthora infestans]
MNSLAGFVESKSMFKIFAAAVLVPVHWLVLILATWYFLGSSYAYVLAVGLPLLLYSHIRVLEESRSIAENVYFLFNITAHADKVAVLRTERELLAQEVHELVTKYVDAKFLSAIHKSLASSPVNRRLRHRASSTSDTLLTT